MGKRLLLLLMSIFTLQSSDTNNVITIKLPTLLHDLPDDEIGYRTNNKTTVAMIIVKSKQYYLGHMTQLFTEEIKDAPFFLTASCFATPPSLTLYEESKPLAEEDSIDDMKKMYDTNRFTLHYSSPKKTKRKRLVSTR